MTLIGSFLGESIPNSSSLSPWLVVLMLGIGSFLGESIPNSSSLSSCVVVFILGIAISNSGSYKISCTHSIFNILLHQANYLLAQREIYFINHYHVDYTNNIGC